jgi:hypothetical protein
MKSFVASLLIFFGAPLLVFSQKAEDLESSKSIVVWKDMTVPARTEYENIVVMSGVLDFFGKTEKLVVLGGRVKVQAGATVKDKLVVLGGSVERLEGSTVPENPELLTPPTSVFERWKSWGKSWVSKWRHRLESPDNEETESAESPEGLGKIFLIPLVLTVPLILMIVVFIFALVFFRMAPRISETSDQLLRTEPFVSLLWGALAYLFSIPLIAILTLSIIGIPLVPLVILVSCCLILAGFFTASRSLGGWIFLKLGILSPALHVLLGLILLYGVLFMPFFGKLLLFFILISGTGAVLRSIFDARSIIRFGRGTQSRTYDI